MPTSTPSSSSSSTSRSFVSMTGILVSVLCAAAVGGGLATLMHQQKEAALQHRLVLFDTKLTELTATVSMLTTMSTGTDTDTATATVTGSSSTNRRRLSGKAAFESYGTLFVFLCCRMNTKSTQQIQTHTHTSDVFFFETNKRRTSNLLFLSFFLLVSLQYITPKFIRKTKIYK